MRGRCFSIGLAVLVALCGVSPALALDPTRAIAQMYHRAYTQEDGVPSGVTTIAQTPDGYLWVGSASGLYRFDGVRFEAVAADQLIGPSVIGLYATSSGDLWIGYDMGGGISRLRDGKIEHFRSEAGGPAASVNNIRVSDDGAEVWTHGAYTVWRQYDGKWTRVLIDWEISSIEMARGGVVWAKNSDQLFYCRPKGGECHVATGYAGGVTGFARDREGRVWTSDTNASGRMYRLPDISGLPDSAIPGPDYGASVPDVLGNRIFLDRDGTLWGSNYLNGVFRMRSLLADQGEPAKVDTFNADDGLTNNLVSRFFEDREGSIWISTKGGLDQFRPAGVVLEKSIPSNVGQAAYYAQAIGDSLYIHANTGGNSSSPSGPLFKMSANGGVEHIVDNMPSVSSIAGTGDGVVWMNSGSGLSWLDGSKLTEVPPPPEAALEYPPASVVAIVARPDNTLWAWLWINGAWEVSGGEWRRHPTMPTAEQLYRVELIKPGRDGAVWMSHYDPYKLFRHQDGGFQSFSDADVGIGAISNITVYDRLEYLSGETGIAIFDGQRFSKLGSDRVPALVSVRDARATESDLWVVSRDGILRFDRAEAERAMRDPQAPAPAYELFNQLDGLPAAFELSSQSNAEDVVFPRPDGRVVVLTGAGVVWIDPRNIFRNTAPPPVVIKSLAADGQVYDAPQATDLPAGTSGLEIDYAALSFIEPSRVQFRYRLEGVDADWVDPGARRQAFYTRLEPGTYRFQVRAANDAGIWNDAGATLSFTIAPTFLQSIWFKLLLATGLLALASAAYAWRVRWETARIRRQFEIRIAERERIARELHDTLLQGVQGLMLRFQSAANLLPSSGEARSVLEEGLDRADAVLAEGRARVRELRTATGPGDLPQALSDAAATLIDGGTPRFQLTIEGGQRALHPAVAEEVLRIAEEAFRNSVRHAHAPSLDAILTYARSGLSLIVRDDGVGMDDETIARGERAGHFGLVGMRERASRIGGRFAIESRQSAGTDVTLFVPADKAYRDAAPRLHDRLWRRKTS
ncbi:hypothetical protein sos41_07070 [Alphaproteobacteria bacterium SO-S41]|nr:hypothetical protein sos41_07070 [Alphaproteobacteria bacterium SO-S41]